MTWLLDGNVLVAAVLDGHPHHVRVRRWRGRTSDDGFATCAITEGTLLRLHMRFARDRSAAAAWAVLRMMHAHPHHAFWCDGFSYASLDPIRITSHADVTDAWLVSLAVSKGAKLATLDEALVARWPETAELVSV